MRQRAPRPRRAARVRRDFEPAAQRSWSTKSGASVVLTATLGASELSISCVRNHYARRARDQVKAACIRDHVDPHGDDLPVPPIALS